MSLVVIVVADRPFVLRFSTFCSLHRRFVVIVPTVVMIGVFVLSFVSGVAKFNVIISVDVIIVAVVDANEIVDVVYVMVVMVVANVIAIDVVAVIDAVASIFQLVECHWGLCDYHGHVIANHFAKRNFHCC